MTTEPASSPEDETYEFVGPADDGWYRTQIPDWIALHPGLKDGSYRLFTIVRSLILEKRAKVRLLTMDQLAFLMVGKNGKPVGASTIKDLLANLHDIGLMENPDRTRLVSSTGHGGIQSRRRYKLNDWPADKDGYLGWRNTWDKLDAYTTDWRKTRTDVFAGQISGRKTSQRDEQREQGSTQGSGCPEDAAPPHAKTEEPAGQFNGRNSVRRGRNSVRRGRNSARHSGVTSDDASSLKDVPQGASSSSGTTDIPPTPRGPVNDEEESPSALGGIEGAVAVVMERTDATHDEAQALMAKFIDKALKRGKEIEQPDEYVRRFKKGDLEYHLGLLRRQRAPEARTGASVAPQGACSLHSQPSLPCRLCVQELRAEGEHARQILTDLLREVGPDARPDLVDLLKLETV